jgi:hypothetical protein
VGAPETTSSGLGDIQIGGVIGLFGSPALPRDQYAAFRTPFSMGVLGRVYFPTGAYSATTSINLGVNRFSYQLGLPTTIMLGQSYADPSLTALEILPTLTFYSDNHEPFRGAVSAKEPLFSVEAHLTHNFARRVWISGDLLYRQGGETKTDGVPDNNATRGWSAGASAAFPFISKANLILTYEHIVERSDNGPIGWFFRSALVVPF